MVNAIIKQSILILALLHSLAAGGTIKDKPSQTPIPINGVFEKISHFDLNEEVLVEEFNKFFKSVSIEDFEVKNFEEAISVVSSKKLLNIEELSKENFEREVLAQATETSNDLFLKPADTKTLLDSFFEKERNLVKRLYFTQITNASLSGQDIVFEDKFASILQKLFDSLSNQIELVYQSQGTQTDNKEYNERLTSVFSKYNEITKTVGSLSTSKSREFSDFRNVVLKTSHIINFPRETLHDILRLSLQKLKDPRENINFSLKEFNENKIKSLTSAWLACRSANSQIEEEILEVENLLKELMADFQNSHQEGSEKSLFARNLNLIVIEEILNVLNNDNHRNQIFELLKEHLSRGISKYEDENLQTLQKIEFSSFASAGLQESGIDRQITLKEKIYLINDIISIDLSRVTEIQKSFLIKEFTILIDVKPLYFGLINWVNLYFTKENTLCFTRNSAFTNFAYHALIDFISDKGESIQFQNILKAFDDFLQSYIGDGSPENRAFAFILKLENYLISGELINPFTPSVEFKPMNSAQPNNEKPINDFFNNSNVLFIPENERNNDKFKTYDLDDALKVFEFLESELPNPRYSRILEFVTLKIKDSFIRQISRLNSQIPVSNGSSIDPKYDELRKQVNDLTKNYFSLSLDSSKVVHALIRAIYMGSIDILLNSSGLSKIVLPERSQSVESKNRSQSSISNSRQRNEVTDQTPIDLKVDEFHGVAPLLVHLLI
jgi:hypothetical protein